jgi:hypothetical protein
VATSLVNATDLANGTEKIVAASDENKCTLVVSTKLHYIKSIMY